MYTSISSRGILLLSARLSLLLVVCLATSLTLTPISPTAANTPARLVKDIDTRPQNRAYGNPHDFTAVGDTIYFAVTDETNGQELWRTDSTTEGTTIVRDIAPLFEYGDSQPQNFVSFNGILFFSASAYGRSDKYLWKSDGTATGTIQATDLGPRMQEPNVRPFMVLNNALLLFVSSSNSDVTELWSTDGTTGSAQKIKDIGTIVSIGPDAFTDRRFFVAKNQQFGEELWVTDGTTTGTKVVRDIIPGSGGSFPTDFMPVGIELWFTANSPDGARSLWKTDGTTTQRIIEFPHSGADDIVYMNGQVYFFTSYSNPFPDMTITTELWKSDGTETGTTSIVKIVRGEEPADDVGLYQMIVVDNTIFFTAQSEGHGTELWKSDGTAAGTQMVRDINPGTASSLPATLTDIDGTLFFTAIDSRTGRELWKSDGTAAGTQMVRDINPGSSNAFAVSRFSLLTKIDNHIFFGATTEKEGTGAWISDGTTAGTKLLKDIDSGTSGAFYYLNPDFGELNGTLFFAMSDNVDVGVELWQTDGTADGTNLLKDIHAGKEASYPAEFTPLNDTMFFTAGFPQDIFLERNLWKTDGTPEGTEQVKDFTPIDASNTKAEDLMVVEGKLFFTVDDKELWVSDGTHDGTVQIESTPRFGNIKHLTDVNGTLFFVHFENDTKHTLWKTDGTESGTMMLKEVLFDRSRHSFDHQLVNLNGLLLFQAYNGNGLALWKSDGTPEGTQVVKSSESGFSLMTESGGTLFFIGSNGSTLQLWTSDGTSENTIPIKDINRLRNAATTFVDINGTLFFVTNEENGSCYLWKSNGTTNGTTIVKELNPTSDGFCPKDMHPLPSGERAVFVAYDKETGVELWQTDGTAEGTRIVQDIARGPASSQPQNITVTDDKIYFTANDGQTGQELWVIDNERLSTANSIFLPLIVR
ncbi:MAG: ELWxxDGT repeat protein [Chloroflexota bacterium]